MDEKALRSAVIRLASTKPELRKHLLPILKKASTTQEKVYQASNRSTPTSILVELAKDLNDDVRVGVASNRSTPPEALAELAKDPKSDVLSQVIKNPSTPPEILAELAKDPDDKVRYWIIENPSTPPEVLAELAKDPNDDVRYWVAKNPSTPPEVLVELAKDPDGDVRYCVIDSLSTPPSVLAELAKDPDDKVRAGVAKNPSTPPEALAGLAKDHNDDVRFGVAKNPSTPPEALAELAKDHNGDIRFGVAWNRSTPTSILVELAKDLNDGVRVGLSWNPKTPPEVLAKLAKDPNNKVRAGVVDNPSTPIDLLNTLSEDTNEAISEAAIRRLYKVDPSLKKFKGDPKIFHKLLNHEQAEKLIKGHSSLPEKESYSWGEISKALNVPSLPKEAQSALLGVKDKSGRVDTVKLKETVTTLVGGVHQYDIGLDAYSGLQTIHPEKKTDVIQLNISSEFEARLKSSPDYDIIERYINWLTGDTSGHPVEKGKTIAWARVTDFGKQKTLIIEELQSDVCSGKAIEAFVKHLGDKASATLNLLRKMIGDWEFSALQAVKRFAEHKGYQTLYMVPGSVKSKGNKRSEGYDSGEDSALKRIYDTIPAKVGFKMVNKSDLPDWLESNENIETGLWVIETHQMKVGKMDEKSLRSAVIRLASAKPELRGHLLPILAKTALSAENESTDRATSVARLKELAKDKASKVRKNVAEHPKTPEKVLKQLSTDTHKSVAEAAKKRLPKTEKKASASLVIPENFCDAMNYSNEAECNTEDEDYELFSGWSDCDDAKSAQKLLASYLKDKEDRYETLLGIISKLDNYSEHHTERASWVDEDEDSEGSDYGFDNDGDMFNEYSDAIEEFTVLVRKLAEDGKDDNYESFIKENQ